MKKSYIEQYKSFIRAYCKLRDNPFALNGDRFYMDGFSVRIYLLTPEEMIREIAKHHERNRINHEILRLGRELERRGE